MQELSWPNIELHQAKSQEAWEGYIKMAWIARQLAVRASSSTLK